MKIGFSALCSENRSGTGRYARELLKALAQLDWDNEYHVLLPADSSLAQSLSRYPNFKLSEVRHGSRLSGKFMNDLTIGRWVNQGRFDLFHGPSFILPLGCNCPAVVTVHDLAFKLYPETISRSRRLYYRAAIPRSIRMARLIMADSKSTARGLEEHFDVKADRIRVVPLGVDKKFFEPIEAENVQRVLHSYNIPSEFILTVGTQEPRKNLARLIEAYAELLKRTPGVPDLVIAGRQGWGMGLQNLAGKIGVASRVRFPGYIREEDLPSLYRASAVFASVSLYEGFGLPILEAMACGVCVVCSEGSSYPEVAGQQSIYVDPLDKESIMQGLAEGLKEKDTGSKERIEHASRFTWGRSAEATLACYKKAAAK